MIQVLRSVCLFVFTMSVLAFGQLVDLDTVPCKVLEGSTPDNLSQYLDGERQSLASACVVYAIKSLGRRGYTPAPAVISRYLDYEDPHYEVRKQITVRTRPLASTDKYPAINALLNIGEDALPSLVSAIRAGLGSVAQRNAVFVVMSLQTIRIDPEAGVRLLNDANRSARDAAVSARFFAAAQDAVRMCREETRRRCEMVLWDQSGK